MKKEADGPLVALACAIKGHGRREGGGMSLGCVLSRNLEGVSVVGGSWLGG